MRRLATYSAILSAAQGQAERRGANVPQNQNQGCAYCDAETNQEGGQSGAPEDRGVEMDVQTTVVSLLCTIHAVDGLGTQSPAELLLVWS